MAQSAKKDAKKGEPKTVDDVRSLARKHTKKAIRTLLRIMNDKEASHSARVQAADALLTRGWGRPPQAETPDGQPFKIVLNVPRPGMDPSPWGVPSDPEERKRWLMGLEEPKEETEH